MAEEEEHGYCGTEGDQYSQVSWDDEDVLPAEVLVIIFKKLPLHDRFNVPIICRSWREASRNWQCWESMLPHEEDEHSLVNIEDVFIKRRVYHVSDALNHFYERYRGFSDKVVRTFIERSNGNATTIFLPPQRYNQMSEILDFISQRCPKLKNLCVGTFYEDWSDSVEVPKALLNLLCSCKELELLDLGCLFGLLSRNKQQVPLIDFCPKLRGLRLSGFDSWEMSYCLQDAGSLFSNFRNLQLLNSEESDLSAKDLENLVDGLKDLKFLRLGCCDYRDDGELAEKCKRISEFIVEEACYDDEYDYYPDYDDFEYGAAGWEYYM